MKVCHVITRLILGGAQENTLLTVRGLHEDPDYEVDLITGPPEGQGELVQEARDLGIEPILIDSLQREINPLKDLQSFVELVRLMNKNSYDLVHTHSSKAGILGRWAAFLLNVPLVFHTIHGLPFHRYQPRYKYWLFRLLEVTTGYFTGRIQAVCQEMISQAKNAGIKPKKGFKTVYSGMKLQPFLNVPETGSNNANQIKKELGFTQDQFVFGKIARLFNLKGHRFAIEAFNDVVSRHNNARLLLVGDGILREKLENKCVSLGIRDKVKFQGMVPYRDIPRMLGAMDALVHTSLREGLARVIPQAQAAGRPAISFNIDGAPEAIEHEKTGLLVEPESIDNLTEEMIKLLDSPDLRRQIVHNAKDWVQPKYEWRFMAEQVKEDYEKFYH